MKKLLLPVLLFINFSLSAVIYERNNGYIIAFQLLEYDDFHLNLITPSWQPRLYYAGLFPGSTGYFYVNNWDGNIGIYGSNRYVKENSAQAFYQSLHPLELNLLPYATPSAGRQSLCQIVGEEDTSINGIPAKKVILKLEFPNKKNELVISYIFTKLQKYAFSEHVVGYTFSISCYEEKYPEQKELVDSIIQKLTIR